MKYDRIQNRQGGYALITALIFFLAGTTAAIAGLSDAVFREIKMVKNESYSKQSYYASESLLEDAIYRVKNGMEIGATESLVIASSTASSTLALGFEETSIIASSDVSGAIRRLESNLATTQGAYFPYVLQAGVGGLDLANGTVTGDIYTTGSIRGCGSCSVSGLAVSAGQSVSTLDQENSLPPAPENNITFGNFSTTQDLAQSFTVSDTLSLTALQIHVRKNGNPASADVFIVEDFMGSPSESVLASSTLSPSQVSSSYGWVNIPLSSNPVLEEGVTYWIVLDASGTSASNYYVVGGNGSTYSSGLPKTGRRGLFWNLTSPPDIDMYFKISIGANEEGIKGEGEHNRLSVGSGYAYNIRYVDSDTNLYCQMGSDNNKDCDTSRGDPVVEENPISDAAIDIWKEEAEAGGIEGDDVEVGHQGATIGPRKIEGDLEVSGGGELLVSGVIWVTGDVTIEGGATVGPFISGKSYVIIADGTISLSGGAEITGESDSHIILLPTSVLDPAITITGGSNDAVLMAPKGGALIDGGATARAGYARHITVNGGANLVYDPSVAALELSSGSSGSGFRIKSWKEVE